MSLSEHISFWSPFIHLFLAFFLVPPFCLDLPCALSLVPYAFFPVLPTLSRNWNPIPLTRFIPDFRRRKNLFFISFEPNDLIFSCCYFVELLMYPGGCFLFLYHYENPKNTRKSWSTETHVAASNGDLACSCTLRDNFFPSALLAIAFHFFLQITARYLLYFTPSRMQQVPFFANYLPPHPL